jgi:hypothetical protein
MAIPSKGSDNSALQQKIRMLLEQKEEKDKRKAQDIEKLKKQNEKEETEIKSEISRTLRELQVEDEEKFKEDQERKKASSNNLERTIELEAPEKSGIKTQESQFGYTTLGLEGNVSIYDVANQEMYAKVKELVNTPQEFLSSEERNFIKGLAYHINRIVTEDAYIKSKDPAEYLSRTANLISAFYK